MARKHNSRLHILHLTTAKELDLLDSGMPLSERQVTGEVCVHHLWFSDEDYDQYGANIKWNPSIKTKKDRDALRQGLIDGRLVVVATDHAPHTKEEKANKYFKAPSGGPLVQHALVAMLEMVKNNIFTYELVVERMCHARITSYNVCYTKLLRFRHRVTPDGYSGPFARHPAIVAHRQRKSIALLQKFLSRRPFYGN